MLRRLFMVAAALGVLCLAILILRDTVRRPAYERVPIDHLSDPNYAKAFIGKRIEVDGDAGPTLGHRGRDFAIFEHFQIDHPWAMTSVFVRPLPGIAVSDRQHWSVCGVLKSTPDGLLLIQEAPPAKALSVSILTSTIIAVPLVAGIGIVLLAGRALWRQAWRVRDQRCMGSCPSCGYDLRASKHRCPECGSPIKAVPA